MKRTFIRVTLSLLVGATVLIASPSFAAGGKKTGDCVGAGPQAPRDITSHTGTNKTLWNSALDTSKMNLCNVHFHRSAEHKGAKFPHLVGSGDFQGYACKAGNHGSNAKAIPASNKPVCKNVRSGDTIEVHWVYTSCDVKGGPTLGACLNPNCANPQLKVEARVFEVTDSGPSFSDKAPGKDSTVAYHGSTTGPSFSDNVCSPFQVNWSVGQSCGKVSKASLGKWCAGNKYKEDHAHGVRKLVKKPGLLSKISGSK